MKIRCAMLVAVLAAGAVACDAGGGPAEVQESPTAAPGMGGEVAPTLGPGATEQPDN